MSSPSIMFTIDKLKENISSGNLCVLGFERPVGAWNSVKSVSRKFRREKETYQPGFSLIKLVGRSTVRNNGFGDRSCHVPTFDHLKTINLTSPASENLSLKQFSGMFPYEN